MVNSGGCYFFGIGNEVLQRNGFPIAVAYIDRLQVGGVIPVGTYHLSQYLVLFSLFGKIAHAAVAHGKLQGLRNIIHAHAQCTCLHAVDGDTQFGFIEFKVGIHTQ